MAYESNHNLKYSEPQENTVVSESREINISHYYKKKKLLCCYSYYIHRKYAQHK